MKNLVTCILISLSFQLHAQIIVSDYINSAATAVPFIIVPANATSLGLQGSDFSMTGSDGSIFENAAAIPFGNTTAHFQLNDQLFRGDYGELPLFISMDGFVQLDSQTYIAGGTRFLHLPVTVIGTGYLSDELNEFSIDAGIARKFSENFSGAVDLHTIRSNAAGLYHAGSFSNSYSADITTEFHYPVSIAKQHAELNIAVGAFNLGNKMVYDFTTVKAFIPADFKTGASLKFPTRGGQQINLALLVDKLLIPTPDTADLDHTGIYDFNEQSALAGWFTSFYDAPRGFKEEIQEIRYHAGIEYNFFDQFYLRAGYYYESSAKGGANFISAGAGIHIYDFQFNAAYSFPTSVRAANDDRSMMLSLAWSI